MSKSSRKRVLIVSHDKIGANMAGPGIRYHHMAEYLSRSFDVVVGFFDPTYLPDDSFSRNYDVLHIDNVDFHPGFTNKDIVIAMWLSEEMMNYCQQNSIFTVFDVYAPVPVENLTLFLYNGEDITANTNYIYRQSYSSYEKFFQYGDLFLFSNRRQLDFWMGYVFGTGIISVSSYKERPVFDRFIYAPMGIDTVSTKLELTKPVLRDTIPGIKKSDKILLWTGGIWNWFDARILIEAMKQLEKKRPDIKLVFFGTKHPNPNVPAMQEASAALSLSKKLRLHNKTIFMHEGWVPYAERINYLLEADAAINTTKDTIESEMSHRTRVLDHILAYLPTISTSGDYLSDEVVERREIGITVPPNNKNAISDAIIAIVDDEKNKTFRENIEKIRQEYSWEEALKPLEVALLNTPKLPMVVIKKPRDIPKNTTLYRLARRVIPRPIKSAIIKVFRYGR